MPGNVRLTPDGEELWAEYELDPAGLLCRDRLVAGVGFGFSFPAHDPPKRATAAVRGSPAPTALPSRLDALNDRSIDH